MIQFLNPQILIQMYQKGYFPMAENSLDKKINFYKPLKRFVIPINDFHLPRKLFKEFKKKNIHLE
tara:strand:- start:290 stop:484 length:195 start_codon:yes stop_codon:yes gene_type:complete